MSDYYFYFDILEDEYYPMVKAQCEIFSECMPHEEENAITLEEAAESVGITPCFAYLLLRESQSCGFGIRTIEKRFYVLKYEEPPF